MKKLLSPLDNPKILEELCQKNQIKYLGLFGSYAREEQNENSDIDLLVEFTQIPSLFGLANVCIDFEDTVHKKIDLVMKEDLKPTLKPYIEKDLITLYEKR